VQHWTEAVYIRQEKTAEYFMFFLLPLNSLHSVYFLLILQQKYTSVRVEKDAILLAAWFLFYVCSGKIYRSVSILKVIVQMLSFCEFWVKLHKQGCNLIQGRKAAPYPDVHETGSLSWKADYKSSFLLSFLCQFLLFLSFCHFSLLPQSWRYFFNLMSSYSYFSSA
jgi:hypothetical protein